MLFKIVVAYLIVINLCSFIMMRLDKGYARASKRRIPEKTFVMISVFGGAVGVILGTYAFRHKTKHLKFTVFIPFILIVELVICYFVGKAI